MLEKLSRSWSLAKASAAVLRSDKELMLFPVFSAAAALLVVLTFLLPVALFDLFREGISPFGAVVGFAFYFCLYSVIFFFNSALVGAAMIRLDGGDPTVADGLRIARARIGAILGYAAISATVGVLLQALKGRDNNLIVRLLGSALGAAWTLATFLVVPVLVTRDVGPIDALKQSVALLKRTWGENAVGQVGIGAAFGLLTTGVVLVAAGLVWLAAQASFGLAIGVALLGIVVIALLGVVQSALSGVYAAALYRYAESGEAPQAFEALSLDTAFAPKA